MELASPPRLETLTQRFREAISRDPEWMQRHVAEADLAPGEVLPYHPNMGLSQDEYEEMYRLFSEMVLVPVRDASLVVTEADGKLHLEGEPDLPGLSGITIDSDGASVRTPFAVLNGADRVSPNENQTITGPWSGLSWWHEGIDPATGDGATVSFDLGRLEEGGDGLLYYDAKRMENGALVERVRWTLTYPLTSR